MGLGIKIYYGGGTDVCSELWTNNTWLPHYYNVAIGYKIKSTTFVGLFISVPVRQCDVEYDYYWG